jgi:hypothetical protein
VVQAGSVFDIGQAAAPPKDGLVQVDGPHPSSDPQLIALRLEAPAELNADDHKQIGLSAIFAESDLALELQSFSLQPQSPCGRYR